MTESSTLTPWYNTNYTPSGEVTTHTDEKPKGLSQALEVLSKDPQAPRPAPLSQLEPATNAEVCSPLMDALPDTIGEEDRKSTRLNSSHVANSYAVLCSKKKKVAH